MSRKPAPKEAKAVVIVYSNVVSRWVGRDSGVVTWIIQVHGGGGPELFRTAGAPPPPFFTCVPACHEIPCCGQVWAARDYLGRLLASSWDFPGPSWDDLGPSGPLCGVSLGVPELSWHLLGTPGACLGTLWGCLGLSVASLGSS